LARNQAQNQKQKDERRAQILSSALLLFSTKGLAATKVTDIAAAAGMSQGLMYHYFDSKEAIFVELIRSAFARLNSACYSLEGLALSPAEKIKLALEGLLQGINDNADHARYHLLIAQATASDAIPPAAKAIIQSENQIPYTVIARIMAAGQATGTIRPHDPDALALIFWSTIKGLAIHRAVHGERFNAPDPTLLMPLFLPEPRQGGGID
jgi:AcrR family transcriptional regulator